MSNKATKEEIALSAFMENMPKTPELGGCLIAHSAACAIAAGISETHFIELAVAAYQDLARSRMS